MLFFLLGLLYAAFGKIVCDALIGWDGIWSLRLSNDNYYLLAMIGWPFVICYALLEDWGR